MLLTDYIAIIVLVVLLGAQLWLRPLLEQKAHLFYLISIGAILTCLAYYTNLHYYEQLTSPGIGRNLLPPYTPLSYFLHFVWSWLWARYLIALGVSLIFLAAIRLSPKRWREVRFEPDEPYLIATGLFVVGNPYWIFYLAAVAISYVVFTAVQTWMHPQRERVSFYFFWIPIAIITVALIPFIKHLPLVTNLTITSL